MRAFVAEVEASGAYADWQLKQAGDALRLYDHNFRAGAEGDPPASPTPSPRLAPTSGSLAATADLQATLRAGLGLRHCLPRTVDTYVGWLSRYAAHGASTGIPAGRCRVDGQGVKDYLQTS